MGLAGRVMVAEEMMVERLGGGMRIGMVWWIIEEATLVLLPPPPQVQLQAAAEEVVNRPVVDENFLKIGVVEALAAAEVLCAEVVAGVVETPAADNEDQDLFGMLVARVSNVAGQVIATWAP